MANSCYNYFCKYLEEANQGDAEAQFQVGTCYECGIGVEKDGEKSFKYYLLAANQGLVKAQFKVGRCYGFGIGVKKYDKKRLEYYLLAAGQGLAKAPNDVGDCYHYGIGVEKDEKKAYEYYLLAAHQGHPQAQYEVGRCYEFGRGVEKDEKKGFEYYLLSADQGHADAQNNVGYCYEKGIGVEKDEKKGFEYFLLSADQGHARAQNNVGHCYFHGKGVKKDEKKGFRLCKLSADKGDVFGQKNVGECYKEGVGVGKDVRKAMEYLTLAVEHCESSEQLAKCNKLLEECKIELQTQSGSSPHLHPKTDNNEEDDETDEQDKGKEIEEKNMFGDNERKQETQETPTKNKNSHAHDLECLNQGNQENELETERELEPEETPTQPENNHMAMTSAEHSTDNQEHDISTFLIDLGAEEYVDNFLNNGWKSVEDVKTLMTKKILKKTLGSSTSPSYCRILKHLKTETEKVMDLKMGKKIGVGFSGTVYSAKFEGERVAVKELNTQQQQLFKELQALVKLQTETHPHVVQLKALHVRRKFIIMEFMENGDLLKFLCSRPLQQIGTIFQWGIQIAKGMEYLHSHNIIHRDLALRNILLSKKLVAKIGDFGMSKALVGPSVLFSSEHLPLYWLPPECWKVNAEGSKATDVWSFGVTLWEMITLQKPYHGKTIDNLIHSLKHQHQVDNLFHFNFPFCNVAKTCLNLESDKRPSFTQLVLELQHKFEELEEEIKKQQIECGHNNNWKNTTTRVSGPVIHEGYDRIY